MIKEAIKRQSFKEYSKAVTIAYIMRPVKDTPEILRSWDILNRHNQRMFDILQSKVKVEWTSDDPYKTAQEMREKVKKSGIIYINTDYSSNLPSGWSEEDNWKFRTVHDFIVHIGGKVDFTQKGEIQAFNVHAKIVPPAALDALFSEVVAQAAYATTMNDFPKQQKACKLYGFDYKNIGNIDYDEYRKNFTVNPKKEIDKKLIDRIITSVQTKNLNNK